jgi:hypothetical protein
MPNSLGWWPAPQHASRITRACVCTNLFGLTYLLVYVLEGQTAGTTHTQRGAQHTAPHQHGPMTGGRAKRTCRVGASLGLCYVFYLHHCVFGCSQAVNTKCLQRYPAVDLLFCDWGTSSTHPRLGRGVLRRSRRTQQPLQAWLVRRARSKSEGRERRISWIDGVV